MNANSEIDTGSIYESAQECLEDNLPALSTETLIALKTILNNVHGVEGSLWLRMHLDELVEARRNAAA